MFAGDHLFFLIVKLCNGKLILVNAYKRAPRPLTFPSSSIKDEIGEGKVRGIWRGDRSDLQHWANGSQIGVAMPFKNVENHPRGSQKVGKVFIIAFRFGTGMGFLLAENGPLILCITSNLFKQYHGDDWGGLFELVHGYGLARSSMVLFGKVGKGIHSKVADVDATLIGKVKGNNPKDHPRNSVVIANNVGGNVGDIVGTRSDLFGPFVAFIVDTASLKSPELD
ncbi:hypothetical protein Nepgr_022629 [Nepenthes gracilis]|uniref:H(+)-exporting diphosphatase n=1 Tax=Nepenthes gracilis TaxID=150966 RepID=A0AAD3XWZ9_NEPGR|nr:hypothetical protein Nepgr_022629 [Nepenthes gracilis]